MKRERRRPFPTGPTPAGGDNDEVVISVAGMDFTVGTLRHSGYTEKEIAELRAEGARLRS
jgi:hypothetical protein